ncbi:Acyl transferase domain-containing protein [Streptomyces sp. LamerLS-31b]|uniref:type I polyketide synthase n=1 Tax=Streptomyces sp. LamerLS-31b TaxID=1839765 RepID=UPI00081DB684|nr:type I polyketide synthase [Streptomyces sp. LamerLS-31b]SCG02914.1 Acyl transferase domain-containing protein [Streptomyces sp. LamerLS-31b]
MSTDAIAVIGLSVRAPDAGDADEFWRNLLAGRNSIHRLSEEQLLAAGEDPALIKDPHYIAARPLLDDVGGFDHTYFGISPRESELRNPQHRLFLELCSTALQHAGYEPSRYDGEIGVYGGCASDTYVDDHIRADPELLAQVGDMVALVSNNIDYLATYTSYRLGLDGPSLNVRTACSTSLVATHLACQALRLGDCDIALAGGVEIETPYGRGYRHVAGGIDSADGYCRPLDSEASGTVFGSGGGVVVLKRLADALADGDPVHAVIRGSAVNNDGAARPGFTAPSSEGQSRVIAEALAVAGVAPDTVSYVELHGTGTQMGDPVEVHGLHQAMLAVADSELRTGSCAIGSVKSNLGHLGPASGIVGLIKTVLALHHESIPPTINVRTPNPQLRLEETPFEVADTVLPWPRTAGAPRRAGVSSFGFGGTNAHVVLEEAPSPAPQPERPERTELLVWSGTDREAAGAVRARLATSLAALPDGAAADVALTAQTGRRALPVRAALTFTRPAEAARLLADPDTAPTALSDGTPRRPVFALPGQGSQHPRAAAGLAAELPDFDTRVRECLGMFSDALGTDLIRMWQEESDPAAVARTVHAQPLLFSVEFALARSLGVLGVEPAALVGHSVGEVVAATLAGVLPLADAVRFVARRAELMQGMPPGRMLAVAAGEDVVRELLVPGVAVSAVNGPGQVVVGGPAESVAAFREILAGRGVQGRLLSTSHAFHTPMMAPAVAELTDLLAGCALRAPEIPVLSAATGRPLTDAQATSPRFWAEQLVQPVLFGHALDTLAGEEPARILEVGPGQALSSLIRRHPGLRDAGHRAVGCLPRPADAADGDRTAFLTALAHAWCDGADVEWEALPRPKDAHRVVLPGYPYRRREFWLPYAAGGRPAAAPSAAGDAREDARDVVPEQAPREAVPEEPAREAPAPGRPVLALPGWRPDRHVPAAARRTPGSRGHALVLTPEEPDAARELLTAVQLAGYRAVPVAEGDTYEAADYRGTLRRGHPEDVTAYLDHLAQHSVDVRLLVHGRAFAEPHPDTSGPAGGTSRTALDASLWSLVELFQAAAGRRDQDNRPLPLAVLTRSAVDVTGGEPLSPARAAACALARSAALETGAGQVRLIDVGHVPAAVLATELAAPATADAAVALRGARRWLPDRTEYPADGPVGTLLEERGVYLVTGGLGALGLAVARALAHTGLRPRLALLGRGADRPERRERIASTVAALEAAGAEVTLHAADVCDAAAMRGVFDALRARYGAVHGVLHTAGVAGGGLLRTRSRADMEAVLAAKVTGTLVLRELVATTPGVRFLTLFSSRAALNGLLGSADYAAANAFMDAVAIGTPPGAPVTVSVNWPAWHGIGMAGTTPDHPAPDGGTHWRTVVAPDDWLVAEHRLQGRALLPGAAYFDLLVRAVREAGGADDLDPVVIEDLMLSEPLFVAEPTDLTVTLTETAEGAWQATVLAATGGAAPTTHARARVRVDRALTADRPGTDPATLGAGWPAVTPGAPEGATTEFVFGERFGCVRAAHRETEVTVGRLELAAEHLADLDTHPVHPVLLDRSLALNLPAGDFVPFTCRRAVVYGELPGRLTARMVRRPERAGRSTVDAELYDDLGRAVVVVSGYTKIALTGETPAPAVRGVPSPEEPPIGLTSGITLDEGIDALMRLLTEHVPAQVAVVPAEEWTPVAPDDRGAPVEEAHGIRATAPEAVVVRPESPVEAEPAPRPPAPEPDDAVSAVVRLLGETLGAGEIKPDDDFFALGGDSLTAVQLASRLQDRFGVAVSVADLFDAPTPAALAEVVVTRRQEAGA